MTKIVVLYLLVDLPTACKEHLTVDLDGRFPAELPTDQIGVVGRVDVVVAQGLVHVLANVQPVEEHWSIVVRHEVAVEALHRDLI